ncbi:oligosaccharide flippase family protein [Amphritea atlantica]|uniref:Oligosaccharide flippase family protein n=1 Tax=Amphritea atlantica TaxID=355243 RepID=A0ABY5GTI3_9GAMM|nr:oligosaccharide flippase family protein [Amphritea atlantica]
MIKRLKLKVFSQREIILQTILSFSVRIIAALSAFLLSIVIGRQLGAEQAGYYFLSFSIISFFASISRVGFDNTVLRFIGAALPVSEWNTVRFVLRYSMCIVGCVSMVAGVSLYLLADWISQVVFGQTDLAPVLQSMAPAVFGLALLTLLAMALQGLRRVVASVFSLNISANILIAIILVLFSLDSAKIAGWSFSFAMLLTMAVAARLLYRCLPNTDASITTITNSSDLWRSCLPLWVVMVMGQLTQWSGQFIAGAWVGPEQVAQLAVAQRTSMLASFILMAVNMVVAPRFAAMYKQGDYVGLNSLAINSVRVMVLIVLPIIAIMMLFPYFLMGLFGEGFREGGHLLQILAVGQFINVATGSVGFLLSMSGHEKDLRNTVLISGPIAVGLGFALVPFYGATGSAIATAVAVATQNLVAVWWVKKRLGFNTLAVWR